MKEIEAVLAKHDLAGIVLIGSQTHSQFSYNLQPSWSCIKTTPDGNIRLLAKAKNPKDVEALRLTVGTLASFADIFRQGAGQLDGLLGAIGEKAEFKHISRLEEMDEKNETTGDN